ncbi:VOC family protein [Helcobacillus massiliensis]|uniref:VOC domain-containing protein n=1 Tax=Helcobacillus massiliensis TaxID=521392 RepID=A0A839QTD9_9MICO|nr:MULTISPECIES: VOC family protein [Helcobacillus]MBB3023332.1 hypothetical protein [Helcobacillus massiliensis]MCT1557665.1 VOC family protein [Helcobacillus massiliensis]MCT2035937.1 VOC family protein [Helcobacillus massiliensis]MCT2331793.1 VOC family protein [Helcobacillus massiliensis]
MTHYLPCSEHASHTCECPPRPAPRPNSSINRVARFHLSAHDLDRLSAFYTALFNWRFEDWTEWYGSPLYGITTGPGSPGIDGVAQQRPARAMTQQPYNRHKGWNFPQFVIGVHDLDAASDAVTRHGGELVGGVVHLALCSRGQRFFDTEGNLLALAEGDLL